MTANGYRTSFRGDKTVLKWITVMVFVHGNWVAGKICVLYLNKAVKGRVLLSYEGTTTVTTHDGVQPQPRNGRWWLLQYSVISRNNSMNTQTCIPKHAPKRETTPPMGSPKVFRRAAGPPPPNTPCNLPPGRGATQRTARNSYFVSCPEPFLNSGS